MVDAVKLPNHDRALTIETLYALMDYYGCGIHDHKPDGPFAISPEEFARVYSKDHPWMELKTMYSDRGEKLNSQICKTYLVGSALSLSRGNNWVIKNKDDLECFKQLPPLKPLKQSYEAIALKSW